MDANQLQFILEKLRFSALLPSQVLERLAAEATIQRFSVGESVFREGTHNNNLYLVHTGRLGLEMTVPGRGAVRILTMGPGEMVGWSSLLDQGKMTASVVGLEATETVVFAADKLREICDSNPAFGFHLMRRMAEALSQRLVATRLQLLDLFAREPTAVPWGEPDREA